MVHSVWQRIDRLSKEDFRRFAGEFYTPIEFASKAIDYLVKTIGERWWERGCRLWGMAAGIGNLEYKPPEEVLPSCYLSTLLEDDAKYCAQIYPDATVFQYDYLNEDVDPFFESRMDLVAMGATAKMPKKLQDDLRNSDIKWIVS